MPATIYVFRKEPVMKLAFRHDSASFDTVYSNQWRLYRELNS